MVCSCVAQSHVQIRKILERMRSFGFARLMGCKLDERARCASFPHHLTVMLLTPVGPGSPSPPSPPGADQEVHAGAEGTRAVSLLPRARAVPAPTATLWFAADNAVQRNKGGSTKHD